MIDDLILSDDEDEEEERHHTYQKTQWTENQAKTYMPHVFGCKATSRNIYGADADLSQ